MFNSDTFANRPNFGIVGRIFISTDTSEIYRDTGTSWVLIADTSAGGTITGSGTTGTIPIWSGSTSLGNSSLIEAATLISTTKDIQADAYYLTGAAVANGALYFNSASNRVTLANYNAAGIVHIEVNGGFTSTIFGTDLSLTNNGYISAVPTLTAANNASSVAIVGVNTLNYAASFSANNIGAIYGGITGFNLQTFAGNATFANSNVASGGSSVNSIDFSTGGSTITMTQSSGIRAMTGQQNLFQYQGTNSGTITHAAISQNTGFYRPTAASGVLTITNAYSHLINALDDYGAGFTFTNRFGIYQAGASDINYFAASVLIGTLTNTGEKLIVNGNVKVIGTITATNGTLIGGTGTTNLVPKWTSASTIGNSAIADNALNVTIAKSDLSNDIGLIVQQTANGTASFINITGNNNTGSSFNAIRSLTNGGTTHWQIGGGGVVNTMNFYTGGTLRATLDASGNLGLGVTPSAWGATFKVIQIGSGRACLYEESSIATRLTNNVIFTDANRYFSNGEAGTYTQQFGSHIWATAPSGTAGNVITFTQAMTLHSTNNLSLGSTTDTGNRFYLNGSLRIDGQTSGTAGGNSGQHLIINLDGTQYKIKLENN